MTSRNDTRSGKENQRPVVNFLFLESNKAAEVQRELVKALDQETFPKSYVQTLAKKFREEDLGMKGSSGEDDFTSISAFAILCISIPRVLTQHKFP